MLKVPWLEVPDRARRPGWTFLPSRRKDDQCVKEVGMHAKVGLVCQVWVSLEILFRGNGLSTGAFEGQTVLLHRRRWIH